MDLRAIIEQIASEADDFLAGASDRAQARAGIAELLNMDFFELSPTDRQQVTDGVMAILEEEEFFDEEYVGNPFADDEPESD